MVYCAGGSRAPGACALDREHHHRRCERCGYLWLEDVWDGGGLMGTAEWPPGAVDEPPGRMLSAGGVLDRVFSPAEIVERIRRATTS